MQKRWEPGPFYDYWEFPGGKWKVGEPPERACRREVHEEVGVEIDVWHPFKIYPFTYADRRLSLHAYLTYKRAEQAWPNENRERKWCWVSFADPTPALKGSHLPANAGIVRDLASYIEETQWKTPPN